jgi:putative long chain acyl-CoA synthase
MFCYQTAAYRRNADVGSLITFGSPVDTRLAMPFGLPEQVAAGAAGLLANSVLGRMAVPAWASRTGFRLLDPVKSLRSRIEFILQLHDREALLAREGQRRFLEDEGWVAWPGPALAEFLRQFIAHNRMLEGGFVIEDRLVTLADIACPILSVVGSVDEIAPAPGVRAIRQAAPRADVYELCLGAGHFGLVVGSKSNAITWPTVAAWARWRAGEGELPVEVTRVPDDGASELVPRVRNRLGYGLELAGGIGVGIARSAVGTARRAVRTVEELTREAASQLPRLARLEQIQPHTRISPGLLVEERRRKGRDEIFFLFEDRAYTAGETNERIDNMVRGLISIGIRRGEHVGVLMGTRPSAGGGDQPDRCGIRATAPGRRPGPRGEPRPGEPDHRRPRAGIPRRRAGRCAHLRPRGRRGPTRKAGSPAGGRFGADRPREGSAAGVVSAQPGAGERHGVHPLHRRG